MWTVRSTHHPNWSNLRSWLLWKWPEGPPHLLSSTSLSLLCRIIWLTLMQEWVWKGEEISVYASTVFVGCGEGQSIEQASWYQGNYCEGLWVSSDFEMILNRLVLGEGAVCCYVRWKIYRRWRDDHLAPPPPPSPANRQTYTQILVGYGTVCLKVLYINFDT